MDNNTEIQQSSAVEAATKLPEGVSPEEKASLEEKSRSLVEQLAADPDDPQLSDALSNLGAKAERSSGQSIQFLQTRVGTMLNQLDKDDSQIPKGLVDLRLALDKINPNAISKPSLFTKLFGWIPVVGKMDIDRVLRKISARYETVQQQIEGIMQSLYTGKDMLLKDNLELEQLADQVKEQMKDVQKNAYLGEMLIKQLEPVCAQAAGDPARQQKLLEVMNDVTTRVRDLRTMEQADIQFLVSIGMTIGNNRRLSQTVDRTVNVTRNVITIGIAVQLALSRQKDVLKATQDTQNYAADVLAQNAAAVRKQGSEIAELYTSPVLALDKVKAAYNDLMAAMDEADKVKISGIQSAKEGIVQLNEMSAKLTQRAVGMGKSEAPELPSIEA